jgi:hypothetical protein
VNEILIYWHHVGREHGGLTYATTIQKNSLSVVNNTLKLKEDRIRRQDQPCQFIKYDSNTLVELLPEVQGDVMTKEQVTKSLTSFDLIIEELNRGEFPNQRLSNVVERYMSKEGLKG